MPSNTYWQVTCANGSRLKIVAAGFPQAAKRAALVSTADIVSIVLIETVEDKERQRRRCIEIANQH